MNCGTLEAITFRTKLRFDQYGIIITIEQLALTKQRMYFQVKNCYDSILF